MLALLALLIVPQAASSVEAADATGFVGVPPSRLLDTRIGTGGHTGPVRAGSWIDLQVTGAGGVPSTGTTAVVLNVTVTAPTASGHITVWPTGQPRPLASNINFTAGQTVPNLVIVKVGAAGKVSLYNSGGTVQLVADVSGYYTASSQLAPMTPVRLLDTRDATGGIQGPKAGTVTVPVAGRAGIPVQEATAVVLNVTVTQPRGEGYLTVWPTGANRPVASNVNFAAGKTVPNLVIAKLGPDGGINFYASSTAHVIMDVLGYVRTPVMMTEALDIVDSSRSGIGRFTEGEVPVQGQMRPNSVSVYSVSAPAWVEYNLGRRWGTFATTLSFDDEADAESAARFRIIGDGVPLLERQLRFGESADVSVNVSGVLRLRLEVTGAPDAEFPVFADPTLAAQPNAGFPGPRDYTPLLPTRILDTRYGTGAARAEVRSGETLNLQVAGEGGLPGRSVGSVALNVTVTRPTGRGHITVWPSGLPRPLASNLNFVPGLTVANMVIVPVGSDGRVDLVNSSSGTVHLIADVLGYFPGPQSENPPAPVLFTEALDRVDSQSTFARFTEGASQIQGRTAFSSVHVYTAGTTPNWADYNLSRHWRTLSTTLGFDDAESSASSVVRFRIIGDGVPLVDRTLRFGEFANVSADVSGVLRLRLEVTGVPSGRYPVFADPRLS